jgi:hypothetical protein
MYTTRDIAVHIQLAAKMREESWVTPEDVEQLGGHYRLTLHDAAHRTCPNPHLANLVWYLLHNSWNDASDWATAELAQPGSQAMVDVMAERRRQVDEEGFTAERDDALYKKGELAAASICYMLPAVTALGLLGSGYNHDDLGQLVVDSKPGAKWPWSKSWWKPKTIRTAMVKAAALLIAQIEQYDRRYPGK